MSKTNILKSDAPKLQSRSNNKFTAFLLDHIYVICTFVASFFLMTLAFGLMNVSPFGTADKQIMVVDNWHQYYPFLADFQYKLQHGESLFWNWSVGAGVNNFALMSYYLASPLNFLIGCAQNLARRHLYCLFSSQGLQPQRYFAFALWRQLFVLRVFYGLLLEQHLA